MKEAYVSLGVAKLLKEKRFNWECCNHFYCRKEDGKIIERWMQFSADRNSDRWINPYAEYISAPTQQMAMRWLREEKDIDIVPFHEQLPNDCYWCRIERNLYTAHTQEPIYSTYEDAVEAALEYVLTNLI